MLLKIIYLNILGLPFIAWLGIITLLLFIFTAFIAYFNTRGINKWPITYKMHIIMAIIAIILAITHGILGIIIYF